MVFAQYASFRSYSQVSAFSVIATAGGNTTIAHSYNYYLQLENRAGVNLLSDPISVIVPAGNKAVITINNGAIASGEEVFWYVVSAEDTGNSTDAKILCRIQAREANQVTVRPLPLSIELTEDEHFVLGGVVVDLDSLPNNPANGNIRFVTSEAKYYLYDVEAINGKLLGIELPNFNNWFETNKVFSSYLTDITSNGLVKGCDRLLRESPDAWAVPPKTALNSTPLRIWLQNGYSPDGLSPLPAATRFALQIKVNGIDRSVNFADLVQLVIVGKITKSTGILETDFLGTGEQLLLSPDSLLILKQELNRGDAIALDLILTFDNSQLVNLIPDSAQITLDVYLVSALQGRTSELSSVVSDLILSNRDRLLIVPNRRLSGVATIEPNYLIDSATEQEFNGVLPNTSDQIVAISGAFNGFVKIYQNSTEVLPAERIRAYVSTENGIGILSDPQSIAIAENEKLTVTVTHPVDPGTLKGTIRSNYPDNLIQENNKADFNASYGYVFLDTGVVKYQSAQLAVTPTTNQVFEFTGLNEFSSIPNFPTTDSNFGLFQIDALALSTTTGGSFLAETITVYWAYYYPSPNSQITKIDHQKIDCIKTASYSLAEALTVAALKTENLADLQDLDRARINLNAASADSVVLKTENLADLQDLDRARINLNAASVSELNIANTNLSNHLLDNANPHSTTASETGALAILNNLGDLGNVLLARTNLGLGTAATKNTGVAIADVVEIVDVTGTPGLPPIDGSQLTGISGRLAVEFVSGNFNANADSLYLIDTLTQPAVATLPSTPSNKTAIAFGDRVRTFSTNNAVINPEAGDTINGSSNFVLDVDGEAITLIYDQVNSDWVQVDGIQGTVTTTEMGVITVSSNFNAATQREYRVKTNSAVVTATLPVTPLDNSEISFFDGDGSNPRIPTGFGVNPLIIKGNGATIQGYSEDLVIDVENTAIVLVYNAADNDWEIKK